MQQSREADKSIKREECSSRRSHSFLEDEAAIVNNEYVLNVAFLSFLGFTTLQLVFAMVAHSQSMMTDCAAMYVDVLSYMVNFFAERLKHGTSCKNLRDLRLHRLYLELVPPLISVAFLVAVTAIALQKACEVLLQLDDEQDVETEKSSPDLALMLLFSGLNLVLDIVNVSCFARVDQAVGIPGQRAEENIHVHIEREDPEHAVEYTHLIPKKDGGDDDTSEHSDEEHQGLNLNMCSAWTHICADTLRSVAVLVAAGFASLFPTLLSPEQADSWGCVFVSIIILFSLVPLIQGLYLTALKILAIWKDEKELVGIL